MTFVLQIVGLKLNIIYTTANLRKNGWKVIGDE